MLPLQLLREASKSELPTATLVRASVNSAHILYTWAADAHVLEEEAAPVITEAAERVRELLLLVRTVRSTPIPRILVQQLEGALVELESLLEDESLPQTLDSPNSNEVVSSSLTRSSSPNKPASHERGAESTSSARYSSLVADKGGRDPSEREVRQAALKGACYGRWLIAGMTIILVAFNICLVLLSIKQFAREDASAVSAVVTRLLKIGIDALDALYFRLIHHNVDVKYSGVTIASKVLAELSSTRIGVGVNQTAFISPHNSLFEFRAGAQDFVENGRMLSVTTPRIYGMLCQQNLTYPLRSINDAGWPLPYVVPLLTPDQCENDAGPQGVFAEVTPPYRWYSPYVTTYRRSGARLGSYYHYLFGLSLALTLDVPSLQSFVTPSDTIFGSQNLFTPYETKIAGPITKWLCTIVGLTILLYMVVVEVTSCVHFRYSRLAYVLIFTALTALSISLSTFAVQTTLTDHMIFFQRLDAENLATGLSAGMTSETLIQYDAVEGYSNFVLNSALEGTAFFTDMSGDNVVPATMQSVADKIKIKEIVKYRRAMSSGSEGDYVYAVMSSISRDLNMVVINEHFPRFTFNGAPGIILGCTAVVFLFAILYVYLTPMMSLASSAVGSPLLRYHVTPYRSRFILYGVVLVGMLIAALACAELSDILVAEGMHALAQNSLIILGSTNRAPSLSDLCIGSCGFPSILSGLYFHNVNNVARYIASPQPYPLPTSDNLWVTQYWGAQLSLSSVPTVLMNVPSFSTPLVNLTSEMILPALLVRKMMATVNINETHGFSIERSLTSLSDSTYVVIARTVGLTIAIGGWCIAVPLLEWLYKVCQVRRRAKQGIKSVLGAMLAVVFILACLPLLNGFLLKSIGHTSFESFANGELSIIVSAEVERLELYALKFSNMGVIENFQSLLDALKEVIEELSVVLTSSSPVYARWLLLEEYPLGTGSVRLWGRSSFREPVLHLGPLNMGMIPVCGTIDGSFVSSLQELARYCYAEIAINTAARVVGDPPLPRLFLLLMRDNSEMTTQGNEKAWIPVQELSATLSSVLVVLFALTLWWTMHTANAHGFPFLSHDRMLSTEGPIPRHYQTLDSFIPRLHRALWVLGCALSAFFLLYYSVYTLSVLSTMRDAHSANAPFETQQDVLSRFIKEALTRGYDYGMYADEAVTVSHISAMSGALAQNEAAYTFLNETRQALITKGFNELYKNLTANPLAKVVHEVSIAKQGNDSYQSYVAFLYKTFADKQDHILSLGNMMYNTVSIFIASAEQKGLLFPAPGMIDLMEYTMQLRDLLRRLYTLDMIVISGYFVMNGATKANDYWPFTDGSEWETELKNCMSNIVTAEKSILAAVEVAFENILVTNTAVFAGDDLQLIVEESISTMRAMIPTSYAIAAADDSFWYAQRMRALEVNITKNRNAQSSMEEIQRTILETLTTSSSVLLGLSEDEITYRKMLQLTDNVKFSVPVETERTILRWEAMLSLQRADRLAKVLFACTLVVLVLWTGAAAVLYYAIRKSVERLLAPAEETVPLTRGSLQNPLKVTGQPNSMRSAPEEEEEEDGGLIISKGKTSLRSHHVLIPYTALALLVLLPFGMSYFMVCKTQAVSQDLNGGNSMGLRTIVYGSELVDSCDDILFESAQAYNVNNLQSLEQLLVVMLNCATRFSNAFLWRTRDLPGWETGSDSRLGTLNEMLVKSTKLYEVVRFETSRFKARVKQTKQHDFSAGLGTYGIVEILETMSPDDGFGSILHWGLSSPDGPMFSIGVQQAEDSRAAALAASTPSEQADAVREYRELLRTSTDLPLAELYAWRVIVMAAREGGIEFAQKYTRFHELVGTTNQDKLIADGAGSVVSELQTYFKEFLDSTQTAEDVEALFTTTPLTDVPTTYSTLYAPYKTAAAVSSYLTSITTETKFRNIFAYNRGLTSIPCVQLREKFGDDPPTIVGLVNDILNASQVLMLSGVAGIQQYEVRDTSRNAWIWMNELIAISSHENVYSSIDYLITAAEWCLIVAFWVSLLSMIYTVHATRIMVQTSN